MNQLAIYSTNFLSCVHWHDDYVIYDQLSGDTHVMDVISGALICALSKRAMTRAELLATLTVLFTEATEPELENYLLDFISKFELLGLLISE